MILGTGQYLIHEEKKQLNHDLALDSIVEVEIKGRWQKITWEIGPGGMVGLYDGDRRVPESLPAKLFLPSEKVIPINRR